ncbi:transcription elongation factor GreB [Ketobacter alkanivorans]|uniref:Transcription elongation factor GreB n=1 Tax=Ketobacter alkanivorans TaxID=1917421 RepID=A0A2K9LGD7_9GAMM|nr:transcription elongation factor GreB [Ketobacter alkanivorans]AUM11419.1 transcription elongation factor GreB [Ketobacter alkanivorans]MCP5019486.1 transcription elongation factor GreB [Ketobacter sp.]
MSRYRPPSQPAAPYITPEGRDKLMTELRHISDTVRPEVTKALSEAAAEGDRSENAEYIYRKKQLREIDSRIRYLVKRLEVVKAVNQKPTDQSRIFFGAWVELEDLDGGGIERYRLVGADEIDLERGWISIDSPMAKALLKKQEGDDVIVARPKGEACFEISRVSYDGFQ